LSGDEALLTQCLVKGDATALDTCPRVWDAALLQQRLNLAILSKGAVDEIHRDQSPLRHLKIWTLHIHFHHDSPQTAQSLCHTFSSFQRDSAFAARAALQDGDGFTLEINHGIEGASYATMHDIWQMPSNVRRRALHTQVGECGCKPACKHRLNS
jgi:hypothetical protein